MIRVNDDCNNLVYFCRCHCGETLPEHAGMQGPFDHFSSAEMMEEFLVPKGNILEHLL